MTNIILLKGICRKGELEDVTLHHKPDVNNNYP
jgi:hypothetical protein